MNYFWWLISFHAIRLIFRYVVSNNAFITMAWFLEWFCFSVYVCVGFFGSFTVHVHIPSFVIVSQWYGKARRSLQWRRAFGNPCSAFQCPRRKVTYRVGFYLCCNLLCFNLVVLIFVLCAFALCRILSVFREAVSLIKKGRNASLLTLCFEWSLQFKGSA